MRELENRIAAWREAMAAALPADTVREPEGHLRDQIEDLLQAGVASEQAFAHAVKRLGEGIPELAREFERADAGWLPASRLVLVLFVFTAAMILTAGASLGYVYANGKITFLLLVHVLLATTGYLSMIGAALVGLCALATSWLRDLSNRERWELRCVLLLLSAVSCVTVPPGILLGAMWAAENLGAAWSWAPVEIGALGITFAAFLQLTAFWCRAGGDATRYVLAVLGGGAVAVGWGLAKAPIGGIWPLVWACVTVALAQVAVVFLRIAGKRNDTVNPN